MYLFTYKPRSGARVYPNNGVPHPTAERAAMEAVRVLGDRGHTGRPSLEFARRLRDSVGRDLTHEPSGIAFRVEPADV